MGGGHGERRRQLRREDRARRDLLLAQASLPAALHQRHAHGPRRRHRRRARRCPTTASTTMPAATTAGPTTGMARRRLRRRAPEPGARRGGEGDPAGPDAGRDEEGPAEAGQLDQRAAGLAQEHAAERQPAEGPRHAHGLGQRAGAHEGGARPRRGGVAAAAAAKKSASTRMRTTAPYQLKARAQKSPMA